MSSTDPVAPKKGWFQRLATGLTKSSRQFTDQVVSTFVKKPLDNDALDELEELLIQADLGVDASARIVEAFSLERFGASPGEDEIRETLARAIAKELAPHAGRFDPLSGGAKPYVVMLVGVNGSGKTTTLGKIASELKGRGARVLIAAGDTFRAAAIEQLQVWADRAGVPILIKPQGSDAASLAFEAVTRARTEQLDVVLIDTAGRLQNKAHLMEELAKMVRVLKKIDPAYPHETLLVLDATVGKNAASQVEVFTRIAGVTGLVMTKLDGTARGGVLVPLAEASSAPVKLIGVGEQIEDLQPFEPEAFARSLVGLGRKELAA
ncbi:signal recognition particle-docking protein FtsY [Caulobacter sp. S45]|uniref:signal recognition particle-docking protein FtsY n=1 Tax=Caulobacter sp. S45 TaxID=1641861 RepID=UPI0015766396|nr:signal recognition particle-docking protein FtsY [Caulobacter sp. S45]